MRQVREDPTTGEVVILATDRKLRPVHLPKAPPAIPKERCPFCPGQEPATPAAIDARPREGDWRARAFPNLYPALAVEEEGKAFPGLWPCRDGLGAHEVLVFGRDHEREEEADTVEGLLLMRDRVADLHRDLRLVSFHPVRNRGPWAGASQPHPHGQLVALPFVPPRTQRLVERCSAVLISEIVDDARSRGLLLGEDDGVVALCPFAPMAPFEAWVIPSGGRFEAAADREVAAVGRWVHRLDAVIGRELREPASNLWIDTPPRGTSFPWHLRLQPRLMAIAGMEMSGGLRSHAVPPEEAARVLRAAFSR